MKRILLITLLAVLLLSAVGTIPVMAQGSAKTVLSCESPTMPEPGARERFQITGTLTVEKSGEPVPDRLVTVYMSKGKKKWIQGPSATTDATGQYTVTTGHYNAGNYSYRAVYAGDKIFKKVTSPTIPVTVHPVARMGPYAFVSFFELRNRGWFVANLACYYSTDHGVTWKESDHTGPIAMGQYWQAELTHYGVPDGAWVRIHVIVVGGKDRTGSTVFEHWYDPFHDGPVWSYSIDGTTLNPELDGPHVGPVVT